MKKIKILVFCFMTLFSTSVFAIFGGGGGSQTAVLLKILAVETASKSEHVRNTLEAIQQTKNLATQLEYEVRNTIQLGKDVASGNEYAIQDLLHKTLNYQETAQSIMYEQDKMLGQLKDIFRTADSLKGMNVEQLQNQLKKVREQQQYAVYDAMTNAGFSATLKQDQQNLQRIVASANSAQGQLQALQAISNLLGEQNGILLRIGTLLETQTKSIAMAEGATNTQEDIEKKDVEEYGKNADTKTEKDLKNFKKAGNKVIRIGG